METKDSPVKENDEEAVDQQEGESQEECSNDLEGVTNHGRNTQMAKNCQGNYISQKDYLI